MAALIDGIAISNDQHIELYEDGVILITWSTEEGQAIRFDAAAATQLYDFLLKNMERLHQAAKVIRYNREMAELDRIIRSSIDKPWLPMNPDE